VGGGYDVFHDLVSGRDYGESVGERGLIQRHAENGAARRFVFGDKVEGLVLTKDGLRNAVGKPGELRALAIGREKEVFELPAVSIRDGGQDVVSVGGSAKLDFSDAGEILAQNIGVSGDGSTESVKVDLLKKSEIRGGALARTGIARVIETGGVSVPRKTAASRAAIDSWNNV
jgi:hypothetical protein